MVEIAYSDKYIYNLPEGHRFPIAKYQRIVDKLLEDKIIGPQQIFDPGMVYKEILFAHDVDYYNKVVQLALRPDEIRTLGVPLHKASVNRALNSVAGTLRSAARSVRKELIDWKTDIELQIANPGSEAGPELIMNPELNAYPELVVKPDMNTDPAAKPGAEVNKKKQKPFKGDADGNKTGLGITIGGGYHHAFYDHGEGFCIFNDLAIAARYLTDNGLAEKILIIDLDVHQGNGTASILKKDDNIFTFSIHGSKNYPAKKQTSDFDLGLPDGTGDRDYIYNLEYALDSILKLFTPDYILYQGGVDVLESDQLGRLGLTMKGCKKRDEVIFNTIRSLKVPATLTLGGGYSKDINVIIQAHVTTISTALNSMG